MGYMDFYENVKVLAKSNKVIIEYVVKQAGLTLGSYNGYKRHKNLPRADEAVEIAKTLGTTVEYLVTGKEIGGFSQDIISIAQKIASLAPHDRQDILDFIDIKLKKEKKGRKPMETFSVMEPEPAYSPVYGSKTIDISRYRHNEIPMDGVKFLGWDMTILPVVGKTAAGKPIEVNIYTDEGMPFPRQLLKGKEEDYFIVEIEGTSMTEAGINNGDYVIIRKAEEPRNGKIMLVRYDNSSTLKRIKIKETKKDGRQVFLYWEDGSGDFKLADSSEYEIQGEFYRNLGR